MKTTRPKTTKENLIEILLAIALLIGIALAVYSFKSLVNHLKDEPSITDLHQQQEMLDYQYSQGRYNVIVY